jgi:predicted lipoprotein with Yx(FWY)xxD motif
MQKGRPEDPGGNRGVPARAGLALVSAAVILLACGCGGSSSSSSAAGTTANGGGTVTVMARTLPGVGTVLVDSKGYTLYMFAPDHHRSVTCTAACLGSWPPLTLPSGARLTAGPGVKSVLLGSDPGPAGGRVVTYDGWPLYTYADDVQPGQATGQDGDANGGYWYVIRPSGQPEIPAS